MNIPAPTPRAAEVVTMSRFADTLADLGLGPDVDPREAVPTVQSEAEFGADEPPPVDSFDAFGSEPSEDRDDTSSRAETSPARPPPKPSHGSPLKLTYFEDCGAFVEKRSILKGIVHRGETLALIGPPGSGKSALVTEISVHAAGKRDWRGHRAKEACGVVVFALERADLFKRRLSAYQKRDGLHDLPIAVADAIIDLLSPTCVETIVSTVWAAEQKFGIRVGIVVIDTYAKGIAANGGDEDKARDQNRAAANLRNVHLRLGDDDQEAPDRGGVNILLVGHTGKDETRGARGSNAHVGDVDVMVQISGDTIKVAEVIKGNDQAERQIAQFKLEPLELGRDEDGDAITTAIVSTDAVEAQPAPQAREPKLTPNQRTMLTLLHEAGPAGLLTEEWNAKAKEAGIGERRRADLTDARAALKAKSLVREYADRWKINRSG
ncbi:AAA family ATPase [Bradyrhizobium sp. McL0616]|uniref:AAA family ATPase n=1 Tax=Bradyrhizobium sp. McL0616 TaxID=3415674 RepID=UPI003CE91660